MFLLQRACTGRCLVWTPLITCSKFQRIYGGQIKDIFGLLFSGYYKHQDSFFHFSTCFSTPSVSSVLTTQLYRKLFYITGQQHVATCVHLMAWMMHMIRYDAYDALIHLWICSVWGGVMWYDVMAKLLVRACIRTAEPLWSTLARERTDSLKPMKSWQTQSDLQYSKPVWSLFQSVFIFVIIYVIGIKILWQWQKPLGWSTEL